MTKLNQLRPVKTMHLSGRRMFSSEVNLLSMASAVFSSALASISLGKKLPALPFSIHMMKMLLKMSKGKITSLLTGFTVLRLLWHHVVLSLLGLNLTRLNLQQIFSNSWRRFFPLKKAALPIFVLIRHVRLCELRLIMDLGKDGRRLPALLWIHITMLIIVHLMNYVENIAIQLQRMAAHQILLVKRLIKMVWFMMSGNSIPRLVNNSMLGLVALRLF